MVTIKNYPLWARLRRAKSSNISLERSCAMGFTSPLVIKHGIGKLDCPTFGNSTGFSLNPSWSECNDVGSPFIIRSFDAEIR